MKKRLYICAMATFISGFSLSAQAQVIVGGEGPQHLCYKKALYGNMGTKTALKICDEGVKQITSHKNKTATHINRGILLMRKGDHPGAVLIHMNDYDGALDALNVAVETLDEKDLHEALFNRALAYDRKKQYREAYLDLKRALELRPDWTAAQQAISNYKVETKIAG